MANQRPIIIIKKKGGHGGHHGGAWKVAYADFVTAMMALFIVLWLLNQSPKIQAAVGGYFRDPNGSADKPATDKPGVSDHFMLNPDTMEKLKEGIAKKLKEVPNFDKLKDHIEMTITAEGLRIDLLEGSNGTFFDSGSPKLSADGQELLTVLAQATRRSSQHDLHRRPHGREALRRRKRVHELGALRGSREFRAAGDAGKWPAPRSNLASARIRRSNAAAAPSPTRSGQPPHLRNCAVCTASQGRRSHARRHAGTARCEARSAVSPVVAVYYRRNPPSVHCRLLSALRTSACGLHAFRTT